MRVLVLTTGGTIATVKDPQTGHSAVRLRGADLVRDLQLPSGIELDVTEVFAIGSPQMTLDRMWTLRCRVEESFTTGRADAVVITHGTDTLEETAFFLSLSLDPQRPVALTGAMRLGSSPGADGPANLRAAILTVAHLARHPGEAGTGTVVVINDEIHAPRFVSKLHTTNVATFGSAPFGPLGVVHEDQVFLPLRLQRTWAVSLSDQLSDQFDSTRPPSFPRVEVLKVVAGAPPDALHAAVERRPFAIVLEGVGGGHLPANWVPGVQQALERDVLVCMVSRCPSGFPLRDTYSHEGSERHLRQLGVAYTRLNGQKAYVLLSLVGSYLRDRDAVRQLLEAF